MFFALCDFAAIGTMIATVSQFCKNGLQNENARQFFGLLMENTHSNKKSGLMQSCIRPLVNNRSKNNLYVIKLQTYTVFYKRVKYPINAVLIITYDYGILADHILV